MCRVAEQFRGMLRRLVDGRAAVEDYFYFMYRDGKRHGLWEEWYRDGTLESRCMYKNGKLHGPYKWWEDNSNGRLLDSCVYENGIVV
jgi:antitoxin component YwqK of YwqJK toxin-antitoxin module